MAARPAVRLRHRPGLPRRGRNRRRRLFPARPLRRGRQRNRPPDPHLQPDGRQYGDAHERAAEHLRQYRPRPADPADPHPRARRTRRLRPAGARNLPEHSRRHRRRVLPDAESDQYDAGNLPDGIRRSRNHPQPFRFPRHAAAFRRAVFDAGRTETSETDAPPAGNAGPGLL